MENETKTFVKPECKLTGSDSNVFMLMGLASRALRKAGFPEKATEMCAKINAEAKSYHEAIGIISEFVEVS